MRASTCLLLTFFGASPAQSQQTLERAVESVRQAWAAHDTRALVALSDTVSLHLPGIGESEAVAPSQAARLLSRYFQRASERALDVVELRSTGGDQGFAELNRRYVILGTADRFARRCSWVSA